MSQIATTGRRQGTCGQMLGKSINGAARAMHWPQDDDECDRGRLFRRVSFAFRKSRTAALLHLDCTPHLDLMIAFIVSHARIPRR